MPADRDAHVLFHGGNGWPNHDPVLVEQFGNLRQRPVYFHGDEVGLRVNHAQMAKDGVALKIRALIQVSFRADSNMLGVLQGSRRCSQCDRIHAELEPVPAQALRHFRACHRVASAQSRQAVDLGKGAQHDQTRVAHRTVKERRIERRRPHRIVMIGFVHDHGDILRQLAQKLFQLQARRYAAGRIIGIAQIYQSGGSVASGKHGLQIMRMVGRQGNGAHLGPIIARIAGKQIKGRGGQYQVFAGKKKFIGRHPQHLA